jgi:hypothetical protein
MSADSAWPKRSASFALNGVLRNFSPSTAEQQQDDPADRGRDA